MHFIMKYLFSKIKLRYAIYHIHTQWVYMGKSYNRTTLVKTISNLIFNDYMNQKQNSNKFFFLQNVSAHVCH
jgi:hypothetical protein